MKKFSYMEISFDLLQHVNFPEPELSVKEFVVLKVPNLRVIRDNR